MLISKFLEYVRNLSVKKRLILFFTLVSCIPVMIVGAISYIYSEASIVKQASRSVGELVFEITRNIDKEFSQIEIISLEIASSKYVKNVLLEDKPKDELEFLSRKNKIFMEYIQQKVNNRRLINNVILYSANGYAYSFGRIPDQATAGFFDFSIYNEALKRGNKPYWVGIHTYEGTYSGKRYGGILSIARSVSQINMSDYIGVVEIQLNEKLLRENFYDISKDKVGELLIVDINGNVISSLQDGLIGTALRFDNQYNLFNKRRGAFITDINNVRSLVTYATIDTTSWKVISIQPYKKLIANAEKLRTVTIIMCVICAAVAVVISIFISTSIVNPINKIIYYMNKAETGDFNLKLKANSNDEVGQLANRFNRMMDRIDKLFNALVTEQKLKKEAELNALQAQINPHFLYNTLNSIRCLAEINRQKQISVMIKSLIELLQNSIGKYDEFITLYEELNLANSYIVLQKSRFNNSFRVEYLVDNELLEYKTLKFLLQPLIENAILHGIKDKGTEEGVIKIKVYKKDSKMVMEVIDNGNGMTQEEIDRIFANDTKSRGSRFSGIGVKNVNDRIKLFFGDSYGLYYESEPGKGTTARIVVPLFKEEYKKQESKVQSITDF